MCGPEHVEKESKSDTIKFKDSDFKKYANSIYNSSVKLKQTMTSIQYRIEGITYYISIELQSYLCLRASIPTEHTTLLQRWIPSLGLIQRRNNVVCLLSWAANWHSEE